MIPSIVSKKQKRAATGSLKGIKNRLQHTPSFHQEVAGDKKDELSGETMLVRDGNVFIQNYQILPENIRNQIEGALDEAGLEISFLETHPDTLVVPHLVFKDDQHKNMAETLGKIIKFVNLQKYIHDKTHERNGHRHYPISLQFDQIKQRAHVFANLIEKKFEDIAEILLRYESYEVVVDETARTLDLLRSLDENKEYFQRQVGAIATFLPRNQPLYAFSCFAIVPSLMAKELHVRAPLAMSHFFFDLMQILDVSKHFPNIHISRKPREEFLKERSAMHMNEKMGQKEPVTDVVVFTGTMENADKMRQAFSSQTLFIANGAGHNPIVITETADLAQAVKSAIKVQLYNQGQDCANPNAILVHTAVYDTFVKKLRKEVLRQRIGPYHVRRNRIGPISESKDLKKIQSIFVDNIQWLDPETPGVINTRSCTVEPTMILKPLADGGNFTETFAPIFFVQRYDHDSELKKYFEDPRYIANAMYITVYGGSPYVNALVNKTFPGGIILHDSSTIIHNTDLHATGIERGTQPYGGYGRGASCISIYGKITAKPTCPQRDIYEQLVLPSILAEQPAIGDTSQAKKRVAEKTSNGDSSTNGHKLLRKRERAGILNSRIPALLLHANEMHWSHIIAQKVIEAFPERQIYNCAAGVSPTGFVNVNTLREVMTSYAVVCALKEQGKKAHLIFSWDDFDRLRKVPAGMDLSLSQYIGLPLNAVPDPLGEYPSFAKRFEAEFEKSLSELGIEPEFRYQSEEYASGKYDDHMLQALKKRGEIAEILLSFLADKHDVLRKVDTESSLEKYFPVAVYSRFTGKDNTKIVEYDGGVKITYHCLDTGETDTVDITKERIAKLTWKVDWPMRWAYENIVFEPAGHDIALPGGTYDTANVISRKIFGKEPPLFVGYENVRIQGIHSANGKNGENISITKMLEIFEPEVLKWLHLGPAPDQPVTVAFDHDTMRQYEEYDRQVTNLKNRKLRRPEAEALKLADENRREMKIPFRQIALLGQLVQWKTDGLLKIFDDIGLESNEDALESRTKRARKWLETYNPNELISLRSESNHVYAKKLSAESKRSIRRLRDLLSKGPLSSHDLERQIYDIPKVSKLSATENTVRQRLFFRDIYNLLIDKDAGPRLATFLWALEREKVLVLLDV